MEITVLMPARSGSAAGGMTVDGDAHRNALHHFDPIAAGILGRQRGETGVAARTKRFDMAAPSAAGIGIDRDRHGLAGMDMGEFGFLQIEEIHKSLPIRPTALVVVKADKAEITSVPGCRLSTSPTVPAKGARTVAWSSWRWASATCAWAFR